MTKQLKWSGVFWTGVSRSFAWMMRPVNQVKVLCGIFILFSLTFFVFRNTGVQPAKIGLVDMTRVYQEAKVFQELRTAQQKDEVNWKEAALQEKEKLEKEDKALSFQKRRLKKIVFERKAADLRARIIDFQNAQMAKLNLIKENNALLMHQVEEKTLPLLEIVAQKRGLDLIITHTPVLYANKTIDVTDDLILELDRQMTSLKGSVQADFFTHENEGDK